MRFSPEDKLILSSIKIFPSPEELAHLNDLILLIRDWDSLTSAIIDRGIAPLFFKKLPLLTNSHLIPENVTTKLQQAYYKTLSRSMVLYEHFRKIALAFSAEEIPVIALKGVYLSEWLYSDIGLRQFSDIDLLIKEENAQRCLAILEEMGYKETNSSVTEFIGLHSDLVHYEPRVLSGISIELHLKLHRKAKEYNLLIPEVWKNAVPVILNGIQVQVLNRYDLLIQLCLHLDKHFRGESVQFTCFNDITNVLEKYADTIDWNHLLTACQLYNCENVVMEYIVMTHKFIHATVPEAIIQKYSSLLTENDERLFCEYLHGQQRVFTGVPQHFENLHEIKSLTAKARYLFELIFPPKSFMVTKYAIKNPSLYLLYYPYRYYAGIKGLILYFRNTLT